MKYQIKTKILSLAKNLNQFSINDILVMLDIEKKEAQKCLLQLEEDFCIKRNGEEKYLYIKNISLSKQKSVKILDPISLFNNDEELNIYNSCPPNVKKRIDKYMLLMKLTKGVIGNELISLLRKIGEQSPEYSIGYVAFKKNQREYLAHGLKALIPRYVRISYNKIEPEIYEYFKKIYLHPQRYSVAKCIELIKENENFKNAQIPDNKTLKKNLKKEYNAEYIKQMRFRDFTLPEFLDNEIEQVKRKSHKTKIFEKYIDAVNYYLKSKKFKQKNKETKTNIKGYCINHLNPFFKDLNFIEITSEKINEFKEVKIHQGLSVATISMIIRFLYLITTIYSKNGPGFYLQSKNKIIKSADEIILLPKQIEKILSSKIKIRLILLFIFSLGINQAELLALDYQDIDFNNKTIYIKNILYNGKIQRYRCHYKRRELNIPPVLFSEIPRHKSGKIFNISSTELDKEILKMGVDLKIKGLLYENLVATHVKIRIDNNNPINLISNDLAFNDIRIFLKKYNNCIPNKPSEPFDPLNFIINRINKV